MHRTHAALALAVLLFTAGLILPGPAHAFDKTQIPTIKVTGDAEVHVQPDLLFISLGIKEFSSTLPEAFKKTDSIIKDVIKIAKGYGISPDYIQTSQLEVVPERYYTQKVKGMGISRVVEIVVKNPNPARMNQFLMDAITAGANTVINFEYKVSDLQTYRNRARSMAMTNAANRAASLTTGTGVKVGKPLSIQEGFANSYPYYSRYWGWWDRGSRSDMYTSQMVQTISSPGSSSGSSDSDANVSSMAMGLIVVKTNVTVVYELLR